MALPVLKSALPRFASAAVPAFVPTLRTNAAPRLAQEAAASWRLGGVQRASLSTSSPAEFLAKRAFQKDSSRALQAGARSFQSGSSSGGAYSAPGSGIDWTRIATTAGITATAVVGLNFALNRPTRDGLAEWEASYLQQTFKWTAGGLGITAITAKLLHTNGFALRFMSMNPWLAMGVGLVGGIGSMLGVFYTAPDSPLHYVSWVAFSAMQGATLSPLFFLHPAILSRAGLYTLGATSGLCYVGATAQQEQVRSSAAIARVAASR